MSERSKAVWVVQAEEACEGGGGPVTMILVTESASDYPEVHAAFHNLRERDCDLYAIRSIVLLGEIEHPGILLMGEWGTSA